jgi:predicted nucleic acid-binding protein
VILVDTSVWIDHFRGVDSAPALRLASAIGDDEDLCLCGPILTEILQGIPSDRAYRETRRMLETLIYLPLGWPAYLLAADLYRKARAGGKTIRNAVDCTIAACAIMHGVPLLQHDRDFLAIQAVSDLKILSA